MTMYSEGLDLAEDLWWAVEDGDADLVRTMLQQGADPNHPVYWTEQWWKKKHYGRLRCPPLHEACLMGEYILEIVEMLVNAGADIDKGDGEDGWTPLKCAARACSIQLVDYLIEKGGSNVLNSEFNCFCSH